MKIDANDPRWTAYALGEIADEQERAEIEKFLEASPEMRELVEEIRQTALLLKQELSEEPAVELTPAQRERIAATAQVGKKRLPWIWKPAWIAVGAAAALALALPVIIKQFGRDQMASAPKIAEPVVTAELKMPASTPDPAKQIPEQQAPGESAQRLKAPIDIKADQKLLAELAVPKDKSAPAYPPATTDSLKPALTAFTAPPVQPAAPPQERGLSKGKETKGVAEIAAANASAPASTPEPASPPAASVALPLVAGRVPGVTEGVFGQMRSNYEGESMRRWPPPLPRPLPPMPPVPRQRGPFNTETYDYISDHPFLDVSQNPLSTFSIDVDTASYSNVRRFLENGSLPPKDAVRIEELVNYFEYDYRGPKDEKPFAATFELSEAPWKPEHLLLRIGLKAREIKPGKRPPGNLVFLLDVSGSMADENKLPLVKESMLLLVDQLTESDRVAIVVYAGDSQLILPATGGDQKEKLRRAIGRLQAGGSTNGGSGIQLAYRTAQQNFIEGGINRVILATDGDFNVGITSPGELARLVEEKAKSGIYLSALGFGMGNYRDATLELLAGKGRGNYAYIDTSREAKKVLVEQINGTMVAIAKDVKIQVEFNPRRVSSYRLIGYEDRVMPKEDFNDDGKTAGVAGAGHQVTALYELVPAGTPASTPPVDPLKYQKPPQPSASAESNEIATVKIRSKDPEKDKSVLSEFTVKGPPAKFGAASADFKFAAAVAAFGMALRDSPHKGSADLEKALEWAKEGRGTDAKGYRQEFIRLIHRAISISF